MQLFKLFINSKSIIKSTLTNAQLGAITRLQAHANLDPDGALPEGCDVKALSRWEGTDEEFSAVQDRIVSHPSFPTRLTTIRTLQQLKQSKQVAESKAERAARHAERMAREQAAKAAKVAANKASSAKRKQASVRPSKLSTYSF